MLKKDNKWDQDNESLMGFWRGLLVLKILRLLWGLKILGEGLVVLLGLMFPISLSYVMLRPWPLGLFFMSDINCTD